LIEAVPPILLVSISRMGWSVMVFLGGMTGGRLGLGAGGEGAGTDGGPVRSVVTLLFVHDPENRRECLVGIFTNKHSGL